MCRIEYITLYTVIQIVLLNPSEHRVYMSVVYVLHVYLYIYIFIYLYLYVYMYMKGGFTEVIADLCLLCERVCVCVCVCTSAHTCAQTT